MFLGIDLGTSGVKALLIDAAQRPVAQGHAPLTVQRPQPGWSEQDPDDWITATARAIEDVRRAAPQAFAALQAIGVSGQMHGAVLLGADDRPLRPAILWNDGRAEAQCATLEERADFRGIGGNIVMAGFTEPKLEWVRQLEPDVFARTRKVLLPKDYVGLWLTGRHMSEMSDAAGTLWLETRPWPTRADTSCAGRRGLCPGRLQRGHRNGRPCRDIRKGRRRRQHVACVAQYHCCRDRHDAQSFTKRRTRRSAWRGPVGDGCLGINRADLQAACRA